MAETSDQVDATDVLLERWRGALSDETDRLIDAAQQDERELDIDRFREMAVALERVERAAAAAKRRRAARGAAVPAEHPGDDVPPEDPEEPELVSESLERLRLAYADTKGTPAGSRDART